MKKFISILGLFMMVFCTFGAMADDGTGANVYIEQLVDELEDVVENTIFSNLDSDAQSYINRIKYMRADKQDVYKLFFFSERLLWRVYDDYVAILDQKSKETSRKIEKYESNTNGNRRIEMVLDDTGVTDNKCMTQEYLCDYPDGFEQCMITLDDIGDILDGHWEAELFVSCDDQKTNLTNTVSVMIAADLEKNEGELLVQVSGSESKFDENVKFRQEEVAISRYNTEQTKKYGKKAVLKTKGDMPETIVSGKTFTRMYAFQ